MNDSGDIRIERSAGYEPGFDLCVTIGEEAEIACEDAVRDVLVGRIEVKRDDKAMRTGNVYVEYAHCPGDTFKPSGIQTTKSDSWCVAIGRVLVIAPTESWREAARHHGRMRECTYGSTPTKGVTLPLSSLIQRLAHYEGL